jgi:hypothetical protein
MKTDTELKQLLAKMLPETVKYDTFMSPPTLRWNHSVMVRDTELLHLCSLVEAGLTEDQWSTYSIALNQIACRISCGNLKTCGYTIAATWQQRVTALAAVKGVTL